MSIILILNPPIYAQKNEDIYIQDNSTAATESSFKKTLILDSISDSINKEKKSLFKAWFKSKAFAAPIDKNAEREKSRKEWKEFLGIDVFYPYFKAKEVESYIKEKASVNFFNMKGRAEFDEDSNEVKYIFKKRF
jgi:hypothetical protein